MSCCDVLPNGCTEPNEAGTPRKNVSFVNITSLPKSPIATISMLCSLKPSLLPHPATARPQALSKLPLAVDLRYSVPPLWTIQSHLFGLSESKGTSISIHG